MSAKLRDALATLKDAVETDGSPLIYLHDPRDGKPYAAVVKLDELHHDEDPEAEDKDAEARRARTTLDVASYAHSHLEGDEDEWGEHDGAGEGEAEAAMSNWTEYNGKSNASPEFVRLCGAVAQIIRDSAYDLMGGRADAVARLIMAQLAHKHGLTPPTSPARPHPEGPYILEVHRWEGDRWHRIHYSGHETEPGPPCCVLTESGKHQADCPRIHEQHRAEDGSCRETCRVCWAPSAVGFTVPDETWAAVVHPALKRQWGDNLILCIGCFARMADEKRIAWGREIEFFPVSAAP